jgi:hypothetical protein
MRTWTGAPAGMGMFITVGYSGTKVAANRRVSPFAKKTSKCPEVRPVLETSSRSGAPERPLGAIAQQPLARRSETYPDSRCANPPVSASLREMSTSAAIGCEPQLNQDVSSRT